MYSPRSLSGTPYNSMSQQVVVYKSAAQKKKKNGPKRNGSPKGNSQAMVRMEVPQSIGVSIPTSVPRFTGAGTDVVNIKRREFVCSFGNGANLGFYMVPQSVNTPGWDFNPGCSSLFPWLSGIATHFERFRFRGLNFKFVSSAATSNPGRYYAAIDYDYDDAPANDKVSMMGNRTANEATIWQPMQINANVASLHRDMPTKFVSSYARGNYVEPRTAYCGFLMVAIDTTQADRLFDMWVEYDVDLITPTSEGITEQDSIFGLTPPAVTNVTTALGGGFAANPWIRSVQPGPVRVVTPGAAGIPQMNYGSLTTAPANYALDLGQLLASASRATNFILKYTGTETGSSPSNVIGTKQLNAFAAAYNAAGTYLGDMFGLSSGQGKAVGVDVASDLTTLGAKFVDLATIALEEIVNVYPSVRYLVPYIQSSAAIGAGTSAFAFKVEL